MEIPNYSESALQSIRDVVDNFYVSHFLEVHALDNKVISVVAMSRDGVPIAVRYRSDFCIVNTQNGSASLHGFVPVSFVPLSGVFINACRIVPVTDVREIASNLRFLEDSGEVATLINPKGRHTVFSFVYNDFEGGIYDNEF